jgi:hypothetical protein
VTVTKATKNSEKDWIRVTYTPDTNKVNCNTIYLVQTCKDEDQTGKTINPKDYKSGTFKHLQDDVTTGGTYVDHVVCEKDPYYDGEDAGKDTKSAGSSDGHTAKPTTMSDGVYIKDSSFPTGVTKVKSTFEVCAICKDDGKILDCVKWTWERTKGSAGKGSITAPTAASTATQEFKDALAKYKKNHKDGTVCPEKAAETSSGGTNVTSGTTKKVPEDPPQPGQPFDLFWDIVNTGLTDVTDVTWTIWLDGDFLASGMVSFIGWFDFATVMVPVPPLDPGPHEIVLIADSDDLLPEYDETDNSTEDGFEVGGSSGVGPGPFRTGFGIRALQPNPTRVRLSATLSLLGTQRATLELPDVHGRKVQEFPLADRGPGTHTVRLELGASLRPGMYLLRLRQGDESSLRKVTIVR